MARIRTIKPSFFRDGDMAALSPATRLTYIGLWTYVDDAGRGVDDPRLVKADVWPLDDKYTARKVEADLAVLAASERIERYEVDGNRYLRVIKWSTHQRINRPTESVLPPSPNETPNPRPPRPGARIPHDALTEQHMNGAGARPAASRQEGNKEGNKEGKGKGRGTSSSSEHVAHDPPAEHRDDDDGNPEFVEAALGVLAERDLAVNPRRVGDTARWLRTARQRRRERHAEALVGVDLARFATPEALADWLERPAVPSPAVPRERDRSCPECSGSGWVDVAGVAHMCACRAEAVS